MNLKNNNDLAMDNYYNNGLIYSLVFINNLINNRSKYNKKGYYLYCIVRGPLQLFITCINLIDLLRGPFVSAI